MNDVHAPNRLRPESGLLAKRIRKEYELSVYDFDIDDYFASEGVHIDDGTLDCLVQDQGPPTPDTTFARWTSSEGPMSMSWNCYCKCRDHQVEKTIILTYQISPEVTYVRSGYNVYPIN